MESNHRFKILMFGWEFPPFNSGGLGVVCKYLTKALSNQGVKITFVLPKKLDCQSSFCKIIFADAFLKIKEINSLLSPYITLRTYQDLFQNNKEQSIYSPDLFGEVLRYSQRARKIALFEDFDIIHVHDWLSFPAGLESKKVSGKPLIVHVHATEFDRTGGSDVNQKVYEIEKQSFFEADKIITVSNFTKNKIIQHYGVEPQKIDVVYNALEQEDFPRLKERKENLEGLKKTGKKIVLFLGRITIQKGPDYFLRAAKKVLEKNSNVLFVIAGAGDMEVQIIETAAWLGIADKVLFTGFLRGDDLTRAYQMADLYVLPSVSEPFGLTSLEALFNQTPVLISKQSGASEVLSHCLKVDFWDIDEMANKILAVLEYPELYGSLKENGSQEAKKFDWQDSAQKCIEIYNKVLN